MNSVEYALLTKTRTHCENQEANTCDVLSLVSLHDDRVVSIESIVYLTVLVGEHTLLYCCNCEVYKCLTSAIVEQYRDLITKVETK